MSLVSDSSIAPGWYPDPAGSFQQRWWNGASWTNDFAQYRPLLQQSATSAPVGVPTFSTVDQALPTGPSPVIAEQPISRRSSAGGAHSALTAPVPIISQPVISQPAVAQPAMPEPAMSQPIAVQAAGYVSTPTLVREYPEQSYQALSPSPAFSAPPTAPVTTFAVTTTPTLVPVTGSTPSAGLGAVNPNILENYQPFGMIPAVRSGLREKPRTRYTTASWLIAVSPLFPVGLATAIATLVPELYTRFAQGAIVILFVGVVIGLAFADRNSLQRHGHEHCASPAWSLLEPLYLLMRTIATARETGRSTVLPLVLNLAVIGGLVAALWLQPGWLTLLMSAV